jgi:GH24 family phage-related lysozyme (muramidase)
MYYVGVVEDRVSDPLKLGRCRVRVLGLHSPDKVELPTSDLPWAVIMQPVTSASMSGIGQSPTGFVEGTNVIIIFRDEHLQQPIIIGSLAGVPSKDPDREITVVETVESATWVTSNGDPVVDRNGDPVKSGSPPVKKVSPPNPLIKKPTSALKPSEDCFNSIREEEAFSSIVEGKNKFIRIDKFNKLADNSTIYPYKDTKGIWTIGWGSTYLKNGTSVPVTESTRLTKSEADALMKDTVNNFFGPQIQKKLRAPVTQSMFDALVSMAYNSGVAGMTSSAVFSAVNSGNYEEAAGLINVFKTNGGSLSARRSRERALFSKDGFPAKDMSEVVPVAVDETSVDDKTQNPVVTPFPPGAKPEAKKPQPPPNTKRKLQGFRDPNGVYPKYVEEPDTHRLARHEKIDQTIVFSKESARAKGVLSGGPGKWSQPKVPYNATYPYNQVKVTESGHVQEFDDSKDNERIHTYHRAGTYEEIDANGTRISRIVGDDYEIMERNGNVLIRGSLNVTIIGNQNIRVENDANIDVLGDINVTAGGDWNVGVDGDVNFKVKGNWNAVVGKNTMFNNGKNGSWDGARIDLNGGKGKDIEIDMGKGTAGGLPEFPELKTPNRNTEKLAQYEVPSDGDPTEHNKLLEDSGVEDASEEPPEPVEPKSEKKDEEPKKPPVKPKVVDCSMIPETGDIDMSFQLSPNYKLKDLPNASRVQKPSKAIKLTRAEVVCNLKKLAVNVLEPIKQKYPKITMTSVLRNEVLNNNTNSDHLYGCAVDFSINGYTRQQMYEASLEIVKFLPSWTQVIFETRGSSTWIHISYNEAKGLRGEKFTMVSDKRISKTLFEIVSVA